MQRGLSRPPFSISSHQRRLFRECSTEPVKKARDQDSSHGEPSCQDLYDFHTQLTPTTKIRSDQLPMNITSPMLLDGGRAVTASDGPYAVTALTV
jgi:hypothetical protein